MERLTPGEITLWQVYMMSKKAYKLKDDKKWRARLDVKSGKISKRNNFKFNRSTRTWEQTGTTSKIIFMVTTSPVSYVKTDTIKMHKYPVTFTFKDLSLGVMSPITWRTGGFRNPVFLKRPGTKEEHIKIANKNIRNQTQLQFFFELEFVLKKHRLLYGRCRANRAPRVTNPKGLIYFDKHAHFVVEKILIPLLNSGKGTAALGTRVPNPDRA